MVILVVFKTLVFALCWLVEKGSHNGFIMSPVEYPTIMNLYPYVNIYIYINTYIFVYYVSQLYPNDIPLKPFIHPYCSNKGFDQFEQTPVTWRGSSTAVIFLHDGSPREMVRWDQVSIFGSYQTKNTCYKGLCI